MSHLGEALLVFKYYNSRVGVMTYHLVQTTSSTEGEGHIPEHLNMLILPNAKV